MHLTGFIFGGIAFYWLILISPLVAGFGYSFLNPALKVYRHQLNLAEFDEFSGRIDDLKQPLVNQPGECFEYGVGN